MIASLLAAVVSLTNEFGTVDVDTFGANVLSYVPAGGREVFFRQSEDRRTGQWYNGGVPVCWPWFGRNGDPGSVLHGFAWSQEWTVDAVENGKDLSRAVLRLERKDEFRLTYEIRLDRELSLRLSMLNLGREKFAVTTGFHPYFSVSHPRNVTVDTPKGPIRCREAMDGGRPFGAGTYRISDSGWSRRIELKSFGNNKLVIWNIGPEEGLPGLMPTDWMKYICVEPAVLPRCDGFYLQPGQSSDIGMSCRVADFAEMEVALPGEPCEKPAMGCAPFPDRMSAYVWRNWGLVDKALLAETVGAKPEDLTAIAGQMGLEPDPVVLPEWRRKGYITIVRRNWHLLPYDQLLKVLDMTREELRFSLMEDDFLWVKLGRIKPKCEPLRWCAGMRDEGKVERERIAAILKEEGLDPNAVEEPRFAFVKDISTADPGFKLPGRDDSPFDFRLIFSYFADYGDPLGDPEIGSFPEGLLQKLAAQGVNAVWLHTVLRTLARDPRYPEFGEGCERRLSNLQKLVDRCAKYGIRVFLYMNEPRGLDPSFFRKPGREGLGGATADLLQAMCTLNPETQRWLSDSLEKVFSSVRGLGGIFTITASENLTNCATRPGFKETCPVCRSHTRGEIIAAANNAMLQGMRRGDPNAEALVWNWAWPKDEEADIVARLTKDGCRLMAVSENAMPICRGGVNAVESDYSISIVGPGENAKRFWALAKGNGISPVAKVQAANSWELSPFPYIPVMDLVAAHACNIAREGVSGVMLSWSLGCCPSPNLGVYREFRKGETDKEGVLDRLARRLYGDEAPRARKAWTAFSDGFANYPFSCAVIYNGPHQWGPVNPLYPKRTGWKATMVGIPYDDLDGWRDVYPRATYAELIGKVADGFAEGCRLMEGVADGKELDMFRAEQMHFASCRDQALFVMARDAGDADGMRRYARAELERAKAYWPLVRADSRIGFESSNHYFFVPRDVLEKVLSCRMVLAD